MVRPRTTTPEPAELIKLGEDLIQWASEPSEEIRCRYAQWYCLKHGFDDNAWDLMKAKPEFQGYYKQAQTLLAQRWLDGTICPSIAHRFLRIYCPEVKIDEDEKAKFESQLKAQEQSAVTDDQIKRHENLMKSIKDLQSERKIDDNKKSTDNKSA